MEFSPLKVFLTVATEKSFSRAAEKLGRTQPAISLAVQRLEAELGEKLIDRSAKELLLTDAGKIAVDFARRFENLRREMDNALAELRDNSAGHLIIGANESTSLYLLSHIERYRRPHILRRLCPDTRQQRRQLINAFGGLPLDVRHAVGKMDGMLTGSAADLQDRIAVAKFDRQDIENRLLVPLTRLTKIHHRRIAPRIRLLTRYHPIFP